MNREKAAYNGQEVYQHKWPYVVAIAVVVMGGWAGWVASAWRKIRREDEEEK